MTDPKDRPSHQHPHALDRDGAPPSSRSPEKADREYLRFHAQPPPRSPARPHAHDHAHGHAHAHDHAHAHGRDHDHDHVHGHSHAQHPEAARFGNPRLAPAPGAERLLFLDCFSGIAGDMTVAALVDLGVPFEVVRDAVGCLQLGGVELSLSPAQTGVIGGSRFDVRASGRHPERTYRQIDRLLSESSLDEGAKQLSRAIFRKLAEAEAFVHRTPIEDVAFHEVGAVDAIADIVGAAAALRYLGARVVATPLPLGRGFVECRHGVLPLPAPATVACLRGVPTYDANVEAELVTPTGAAIVATVAEHFVRWPELEPSAIGWGVGTRVLPDRPNALRAVLGTPRQRAEASEAAPHLVLEANVDDLTGELAGHALSSLLAAGALDAWATAVTMKKGRPGLVLAALVPRERAAAVEAVLLRETSSIGVRRHEVTRTERPRRLVDVTTPYGVIPVKISEGPYGPPQMKPEFDACVRAAAEHGVPVRIVLQAALHALDR